MTAETDLLPCGQCGMPCRAGEYHPFAACLMFKACHNSETVRANLAPLQAEIEALRAEVERLTNFNADTCEGFNRLSVERTALITRAEQLAEALRAFPAEPNPYTYRSAHAKARAALEQEDGRG